MEARARVVMAGRCQVQRGSYVVFGMLKRDTVIKSLIEGLRRAARAELAKEGNLEERLFPYWCDTVHGLAVDDGQCPCVRGEDAGCFLRLSREERIAAVDHGILRFEEFVAILREAEAEFLDHVLPGGPNARN